MSAIRIGLCMTAGLFVMGLSVCPARGESLVRKTLTGSAIERETGGQEDWSAGVLRQEPHADSYTGRVDLVRMPADNPIMCVRGSVKGAAFGAAVHVGDVNGDVWADLVVGAPLEDNGRVYVFLGPLPNGMKELTTADADWSVDMDDPSLSGFGAALTMIPDIDGDGLSELVVRCDTDDPSAHGESQDVVLSSKSRNSIAVVQFDHQIGSWDDEQLRMSAVGSLYRRFVDSPVVTGASRQKGGSPGAAFLLQGSCDCIGDFNDDGEVNGADLGALVGKWGTCPGCPEDLNGSGNVDGADLGALFGYWGPCDSDGDGVPDSWESSHGSNPCDPEDGIGDWDGDGLLDADEFAYGSDPEDSDSDDDGTPDGGEVLGGSDPTDDSDGGEGPNSENVLYVMLTFGDHSCHNSDTWAMQFGAVTYSFSDALADPCLESEHDSNNVCSDPWSCPLNAPREKGPIAIERGKSYPIGMVWLATAYDEPYAPDYDWTCFVELCDESGGNRTALVYRNTLGDQNPSNDLWDPVAPVEGVFLEVSAAASGRVIGEILTNPNSNPTGVRVATLHSVNVNLLMDSNRNATIDTDGSDETGEDQWTYGATGHGAIILCNNDDDDPSTPPRDPDCDDSVVNGAPDIDDLAIMKLGRLGAALPAGHKVFLKVATGGEHVRVFNSRTTSATAVIEPATSNHEYEIPIGTISGSTDLEYGIEAIHYAGWPIASWDGLATIQLSWRDAAGAVQHEDVVQVRVAPWLMPSPKDPVTHVYVADTVGARTHGGPAGNVADFPTRLAAALSGTGIAATVVASDDRWLQDQLELGFHSSPGRWNAVVLNSPRKHSTPNPIRTYAEEALLDSGTGIYASSLTTPAWQSASTFDSFGNLECLPPSTAHPVGNVIHGSGMIAALDTFLDSQQVQNAVNGELGTSWLIVGHIDEFMSVYIDGSGTVKVLVASPQLGASLLSANPNFVFNQGQLSGGESETSTAFNLLTLSNRQQFNFDIQTEINLRKSALQVLGITTFVDIPAFFTGSPANTVTGLQFGTDDAVAALPGMANMLNVNGTLIVPDPVFQPFRTSFQSAVGITPKWIDCLEYHWNQGEVHCGTNVRRTPSPAIREWWKVTP